MSDENEQKPVATQAKKKSGAKRQPGVLANDHDNDKLGEEITKLLKGLAERGVMVDINRIDLNNLKARIEAIACCRILIAKGICTEAELGAACNQEFRAILMVILQLVEEQRLAAQQPAVDTIIKPQGAGKLAIVRH